MRLKPLACTGVTNLSFAQDWALSQTGNWSIFREDVDGNGFTGADDLIQTRKHNKVNEIYDATDAICEQSSPQQSQWIDPKHDAAGFCYSRSFATGHGAIASKSAGRRGPGGRMFPWRRATLVCGSEAAAFPRWPARVGWKKQGKAARRRKAKRQLRFRTPKRLRREDKAEASLPHSKARRASEKQDENQFHRETS